MEDHTEKYMKELFKGIKSDSPSKNFTVNVMNKIASEKKTAAETKLSFFNQYKFIFIFSLTFISIFLIIFFSADNQDITIFDTINFDFNKLAFVEKLRLYFNSGNQFSSIFLIIIVSISMLFSIDYFIPKIRKLNHLTI